MSKSIYEDAFNHLDELVDALAHIEGSFLYRRYLDNIRLKLKQAQKQEKLLELYKQLNIIYEKLYNMELSIDLEKELGLIYDVKILKQRIKELENE